MGANDEPPGELANRDHRATLALDGVELIIPSAKGDPRIDILAEFNNGRSLPGKAMFNGDGWASFSFSCFPSSKASDKLADASSKADVKRLATLLTSSQYDSSSPSNSSNSSLAVSSSPPPNRSANKCAEVNRFAAIALRS